MNNKCTANCVSGSYKWLVLTIAMLSTFMAVLDVTIVNVALPKILAHFNENLENGQWLATAYMLSNIMFLPIAGWMAGRWGFKKIFVIAIVIFTVGSLWCMLSQSISMLIAGRFIAGIGSGIVTPIAMALVIKNFQGKERALALGFWAAATAASISLGPILGGFLVENFSWSSIFSINIPLGIVAIVGAIFIIREYKAEAKSRFDTKGLLLLWITLPSLLLLTTYLGRWNWWLWVCVLLITTLLLVILIKHALRASNTIIKLGLMRERTFALTMIIMLLDGVILFGGNYILPLYVQHTLDYTPLMAGMIFLPVGIIQGTLGPLSGWISRYTGNKVLLVSGFMVIISYVGVSLWFNDTTSHWLIMLSLYLRGLGNGLSFTALNTLSLQNIRADELAQASSISNTIRQFAGSLGIALVTFSISLGSNTFMGGVHVAFWVLFIIAAGLLIPTFLLKTKK